MRVRRRLARSLRARVKDAERLPAPHLSAAVPLSRRVVLSWRESLLGLAERLERPDPVNPCGVARVLVLLTDAMGPLYEPRAADRMSDVVWWIADGLALDPGEAPDRRPASCSHLAGAALGPFTRSVCRGWLSVWALDPGGARIGAWTFYRLCLGS